MFHQLRWEAQTREFVPPLWSWGGKDRRASGPPPTVLYSRPAA